jgi:tetratricopeptide (TPR) repeat protein
MRIALLTALVLLVAAPPARADSPNAEADKHAEAGKAAFAAERYSDAITEFRAANALRPDPKLVYAIAQAQRLAGDCAGAIKSYQEFIDTKSDAKLSEYSEANIARCKEELAAKPTPAPVEPTPPAPAPDPSPAPAPSEPSSSEIRLPPPEEPTDTGSRPWYRDWIGNALVITGVAGVAVGTTFYVQGRNAASKANDAADYDSFLDAREAASSALTKQRIGLGAAIAGVGLVVGGILHYRISGKREVRITAVPTAGGAAVFAGVDL